MVKMFGPSLRDPKIIVNRDVPDADVGAYERAGYRHGSKPGAPNAEDVQPADEPVEAVEAEAVEQKEAADLSKMTKAELQAEAERLDVETSDSMTKAEIVAAIEGN